MVDGRWLDEDSGEGDGKFFSAVKPMRTGKVATMSQHTRHKPCRELQGMVTRIDGTRRAMDDKI